MLALTNASSAGRFCFQRASVSARKSGLSNIRLIQLGRYRGLLTQQPSVFQLS